jgi:hypothetical protein
MIPKEVGIMRQADGDAMVHAAPTAGAVMKIRSNLAGAVRVIHYSGHS